MKFVLFALLFLLPLPAVATTWYVRSDGGTLFTPGNPGQCDGTVDAAYPGHGKNQHCAVSDPRYLYSVGTGAAYSWVIAGGDTVLFRGGPWRIGQNTSASCGPFSNACSSDGAAIPPPPAGTAAQPTSFLGENFASCSTKTQLYGGYTVNQVFDLRGASHVRIACLELTDHSQCTTLGIGKPVACNRDIIDDYAKNGILTNQNTHDITLTDLNIHGFRDNGIIGAVGGTITATRVRIGFNGQAGWNFDDGVQTKSVNGQMNWSYVTIEGNGCIEEYPVTHSFPAAYCYDDSNGGYGDGVGTPDTQISFAVDHSTIRYNTQDGLDLLHTSGSSITVSDSSFYANMGQQLKLGPMASTSVANSLFLTNCKRMSANISGAPTGWNAGLSDFCRAQAGVAMVQRGDNAGGGTYTWQNNDFVGYAGDAMFEISSCTDSFVSKPTSDCNTANIVFQNNLLVGYPYVISSYHYGDLPPTGIDGNNIAHFRAINHNIYYNMRSCPTETGSVCTDPHLAGEPTFTTGVPIPETSFDTVNFALTSASTNAIGKGFSISGLATDYNGATRTAPTTIGALVYTGSVSSTPPGPSSGSGSTTPAAKATFSVTPNSANSGQSVTATVKVTGNVSAIPTGSVTLYLPSGPIKLTLSAGNASDTFTPPSAGTYTVTASYSGDGTYHAATSNQASFTVKSGSSSSSAAVVSAQSTTNASTSAVSTITRRFSSTLSSTSTSSTSSTTATHVSIVPAYRTLYAGQPAALESTAMDGISQNVSWSLVAQPTGGNGQLLSNSPRDTVFSATVAGRYTLLATSLADRNQTATATLYVTGHTMPYITTALGTEPVDCTADPALLGRTYEVGPSQAYAHLRDLPLASIGGGATIRIHNEDTSGTHPTTYHELLELSQHATADQPLRLCGVPDSTGHLPVLDAASATAAGTGATPAGMITVSNALNSDPANIQIEGLQIRNANVAMSYQANDGTPTHWASDASCLNVAEGQNIVVIGNDLGHCNTGGHSGSTTVNRNTLWEGNHLHNNGVIGSSVGNQLSLGGAGEVVQFNRLDSYPAGALGANIFSRGIDYVIRFNYLGTGPARQINLTDIGTANSSGSASATEATGAAATEQAVVPAALQQSADVIYGNVYQDSKATSAVRATGSPSAGTGTVASMSTVNNR